MMEEDKLQKTKAAERECGGSDDRMTADAFLHLYSVIRKLRAPDGCPWDKAQTPLTMRKNLVEEVFEVVDAVTEGEATADHGHAKEELGDVMLNTLLMLRMYEQDGSFTAADCLEDAAQKLVRRHPQVFPQSDGRVVQNGPVETPDDVVNQWDRIKEKVEGREQNSALDEVPLGFPPLLRAGKLLGKAEKEGFVWNASDDAAAKVSEEFEEVRQAAVFENTCGDGERGATAVQAKLHLEEEVGDLLLAVVTWGRSLGVDAVTALSRANTKFYNRFTYVERRMKECHIPLDTDHTADMERFWKQAKSLEKC